MLLYFLVSLSLLIELVFYYLEILILLMLHLPFGVFIFQLFIN